MPLKIFGGSAKIWVGGNVFQNKWHQKVALLLCFLDQHKYSKAQVIYKKYFLPPVVSCEHLQTHLSLSASFVLKSLPGCPMLLILPAVPLQPLRCILQNGKGKMKEEEEEVHDCCSSKGNIPLTYTVILPQLLLYLKWVLAHSLKCQLFALQFFFSGLCRDLCSVI